MLSTSSSNSNGGEGGRRRSKRPAASAEPDAETAELRDESRRRTQSLAAAGAHLYSLVHRSKKARVDAHDQALRIWGQLPPDTHAEDNIWAGMESRLLVRATGPAPTSPVHQSHTRARRPQESLLDGGVLNNSSSDGAAHHESEWRPRSAAGGGTGGGKHLKQLGNLRMLVADREARERKEQEEQKQRQAQMEQRQNAINLQQQQQQQESAKQQKQQQQQKQQAAQAQAQASRQQATAAASGSGGGSSFVAKVKSSDMVAEAMRWRQHTLELQPQVQVVQTKFRKMANKVKVQVNHLAGTITSLHVALSGSQQRGGKGGGGGNSSQGVQSVLEMARAKQPDLVPGFMQVIATRIVQVAAQGTAPDVIKNGESNFALAYMSVALCVNCAGFLDCLMGALCTACPYIVPGLRNAVEAQVKASAAQTQAQNNNDSNSIDRRTALGYEDNEKDAVYLSRMQAIVAFYGALLQTNVTVLGSAPYNIVPPNSQHPLKAYRPDALEPMAQAWRWLAGTLNGTKWRWVRFLALAFVASCGHELQNRFGPDAIRKLAVLAVSSEMQAACDKRAKLPDDTDRKNVFEMYFAQVVEQQGRVPPPGRFVKSNAEDKDGTWVDKRNLPMRASQNLAQ